MSHLSYPTPRQDETRHELRNATRVSSRLVTSRLVFYLISSHLVSSSRRNGRQPLRWRNGLFGTAHARATLHVSPLLCSTRLLPAAESPAVSVRLREEQSSAREYTVEYTTQCALYSTRLAGRPSARIQLVLQWHISTRVEPLPPVRLASLRHIQWHSSRVLLHSALCTLHTALCTRHSTAHRHSTSASPIKRD